MDTFLRKLKIKSSQGLRSSQRINPHKHWTVLLRVFIASIVALIVFSLYLLYQIKNEQIFDSEVQEIQPQNLIKEKLLKNVIKALGDKEERRKQIEGKGALYGDPSA